MVTQSESAPLELQERPEMLIPGGSQGGSAYPENQASLSRPLSILEFLSQVILNLLPRPTWVSFQLYPYAQELLSESVD